MNTFDKALSCMKCKGFLCWSEIEVTVMCNNCMVSENKINRVRENMSEIKIYHRTLDLIKSRSENIRRDK